MPTYIARLEDGSKHTVTAATFEFNKDSVIFYDSTVLSPLDIPIPVAAFKNCSSVQLAPVEPTKVTTDVTK